MTQQVHSQWNENICSYKSLYKNVRNSIIHNSQKAETTQISMNEEIKKSSFHTIQQKEIKYWHTL